jgi:hypothetical protein
MMTRPSDFKANPQGGRSRGGEVPPMLPDEGIDRSDIPELDEAHLRGARLVMPTGKRQVAPRVDGDRIGER